MVTTYFILYLLLLGTEIVSVIIYKILLLESSQENYVQLLLFWRKDKSSILKYHFQIKQNEWFWFCA